jgi:hypothetical protein
MVTIRIPVRTVSEANRASHEHWRARQKRAKAQRMAVAVYLCGQGGLPPGPWLVTLTRIAPRALDGDNLQGALKAARDEVAKCLGAPNDRDGFEWIYGQKRGKPREYAVEVEISDRTATNPPLGW